MPRRPNLLLLVALSRHEVHLRPHAFSHLLGANGVGELIPSLGVSRAEAFFSRVHGLRLDVPLHVLEWVARVGEFAEAAPAGKLGWDREQRKPGL